MNWLLLLLAAYWIGQVIFVMEIRADHPDWLLFPCGLIALAWPYLTIRRCVAVWRAWQGG